MNPDTELLTQARRLEPCALAEVYDLYSPRLYRYAVRLLGDACVAEDCVAETFTRFLQALQAGKGPRDHLQAYLFRVSHNIIVDQYRSCPITQELAEEEPDELNTEDSAASEICRKSVRSALSELTIEQQQVIALKFLEGWDNEDIARVVNKPVGAVKSLQHRALAHLQKILLDDEA